MKVRIPFGDWSHDGHGMFETIVVEVYSMEELEIAVENIISVYGDIFDEIANDYGYSNISLEVFRILQDNHFDFKILEETEQINLPYEDAYVWEDYVFNSINKSQGLMLETIEEIYFFFLRLGGAKFTVCKDTPMFTKKTVGYGCFYD